MTLGHQHSPLGQLTVSPVAGTAGSSTCAANRSGCLEKASGPHPGPAQENRVPDGLWLPAMGGGEGLAFTRTDSLVESEQVCIKKKK